MGQKLYTRWVWDEDGDEFLLWGWGWDHDTRTRPAPLPSLITGWRVKQIDSQVHLIKKI